MPGFPNKLSRTPPHVRMPPPLHGQQTADILQSVGYSQEELQTLEEAEAI